MQGARRRSSASLFVALLAYECGTPRFQLQRQRMTHPCPAGLHGGCGRQCRGWGLPAGPGVRKGGASRWRAARRRSPACARLSRQHSAAPRLAHTGGGRPAYVARTLFQQASIITCAMQSTGLGVLQQDEDRQISGHEACTLLKYLASVLFAS